jgi:hypothetical protein
MSEDERQIVGPDKTAIELKMAARELEEKAEKEVAEKLKGDGKK